jgi:uncharacterized membrane protein
MEETAALNSQARVSALAAQERWIWAAYSLHALGLFLLWPALFGLAINYAKNGDGPDAHVDTHHPYMRRTFWVAFICAVLVILAMVAGLVLLLLNLGFDISAVTTDTAVQIKGLSLEHLWIGVVAVAGGFLLLVIWLWALFRLIRGMVRISQDKGAQ